MSPPTQLGLKAYWVFIALVTAGMVSAVSHHVTLELVRDARVQCDNLKVMYDEQALALARQRERASTIQRALDEAQGADHEKTARVDRARPEVSAADDIDCLLGPGHPKCEASQPVPAPGPPEKLGASEISEGLRSVKIAAKDCGREHDAEPGTKVMIQFVLAGATGRVVSATALDEHATSALGRCVAAKSKRGIFPEFQAAEQRFRFSYRM